MLISNGFQMYQAKTQGLQTQKEIDYTSDGNETLHQIVTPLDSLLKYNSDVS